jgi:hypothetical protein
MYDDDIVVVVVVVTVVGRLIGRLIAYMYIRTWYF